MTPFCRKLHENERAANPQRKTNVEDFDQITPVWRWFWTGYCWPAYRLDRCTLDELQRLRKAVPYLLNALDDAIARKEIAP
jgi:hypothetical protein